MLSVENPTKSSIDAVKRCGALHLEELRGNLGNPYSQYVIDKVASSPNYTMSLNKWVQRTNMNNNKMINNENAFKK